MQPCYTPVPSPAADDACLRTGQGPFQGRPNRIAARASTSSTSSSPTSPSRTARRGAEGTEAGNFRGGPIKGHLSGLSGLSKKKEIKGTVASEAIRSKTCDQHQEPVASPALFTLPPTLPVKTGSRSQVFIEFYGIVYGILSLLEISASVWSLCLCAHSAVLSSLRAFAVGAGRARCWLPSHPGEVAICQRPPGPLHRCRL